VAEFAITDIGQLHWLLGIQMSVNQHSIHLSLAASFDKILELFQMNDAHPTHLPIDPTTRLTKEDSLLDAEEYHHYQSIIGCCIYFVICTRPDLADPISYLSQFLATLSKSHHTSAKGLLRYIRRTKDLKLSFPHSDASVLTLEGYTDSDYGKYLDTQHSISGNRFWLNNSTICRHSKTQKSVATSICEAEYMAHALAMNQWIWLTHALEEPNVPVTNETMFGDNMATIDIADNQKIVN
jgi:hypothetical protein